MSVEYIKAAIFERYGVSLFVGVGIPIPVLDEDMLIKTAVKDNEIFTAIVDKSGKVKIDKKVSYEELRSGSIELYGKSVPTAPLSSLKKAREIADLLKQWIARGEFMLTKPVAQLPSSNTINTLEVRGNGEED